MQDEFHFSSIGCFPSHRPHIHGAATSARPPFPGRDLEVLTSFFFFCFLFWSPYLGVVAHFEGLITEVNPSSLR